jgi:hypothetical protein
LCRRMPPSRCRPRSKSPAPGFASAKMACRICFEEDDRGKLLAPCECAGTQRWVHRECLDLWRSTADASNGRASRCVVCHASFVLRPTRMLAEVGLDMARRLAVALVCVYLAGLALIRMLRDMPCVPACPAARCRPCVLAGEDDVEADAQAVFALGAQAVLAFIGLYDLACWWALWAAGFAFLVTYTAMHGVATALFLARSLLDPQFEPADLDFHARVLVLVLLCVCSECACVLLLAAPLRVDLDVLRIWGCVNVVVMLLSLANYELLKREQSALVVDLASRTDDDL